jgi:acetyltransferase
VALVGATEREGALGNIVFHNLKAGALRGELYAVNPKHRTVFGRTAFSSLLRLPATPELVVVVTPARTVPGIIEEAGQAGIKAAVVLSAGFAESGEAGLALQQEMLEKAKRHGVRILGPNCLGEMRTDVGLNASFARTAAQPGPLALVSQSGAICGAILDWAHGSVGFTSVVSLGAAADVDFGEILDFLVADESTEASRHCVQRHA